TGRFQQPPDEHGVTVGLPARAEEDRHLAALGVLHVCNQRLVGQRAGRRDLDRLLPLHSRLRHSRGRHECRRRARRDPCTLQEPSPAQPLHLRSFPDGVRRLAPLAAADIRRGAGFGSDAYGEIGSSPVPRPRRRPSAVTAQLVVRKRTTPSAGAAIRSSSSPQRFRTRPSVAPSPTSSPARTAASHQPSCSQRSQTKSPTSRGGRGGGSTGPGSISRCRRAFRTPAASIATASSSRRPQPPASAMIAGTPASAAALAVIPPRLPTRRWRTTYGNPKATASPRASTSTDDSW